MYCINLYQHLYLHQAVLSVQMCPEHFVGRMGQVVGKLCCGETKEASALLQPHPQVLGPLGILHLLEGVTNAILKCEAEREKVMHAAGALSQNSTAHTVKCSLVCQLGQLHCCNMSACNG